MLVHTMGHDVGNPFRGCRGTQSPCRSARCPRTFPTPLPSTVQEQADLNSYIYTNYYTVSHCSRLADDNHSIGLDAQSSAHPYLPI